MHCLGLMEGRVCEHGGWHERCARGIVMGKARRAGADQGGSCRRGDECW